SIGVVIPVRNTGSKVRQVTSAQLPAGSMPYGFGPLMPRWSRPASCTYGAPNAQAVVKKADAGATAVDAAWDATGSSSVSRSNDAFMDGADGVVDSAGPAAEEAAE